MDKLLLTVEEAANCLGLGRTKTYELIARGEIESIHIGRALRVPVAALRVWLAGKVSDACASEEPLIGVVK